jgi:hypothetical protein
MKRVGAFSAGAFSPEGRIMKTIVHFLPEGEWLLAQDKRSAVLGKH